MTKYCEECGKEVNTIIVEKCEEYEIFGELIKVNAKILTCSECGEEFYSEELDNATLTEAYNLYRRKHKLLMPSEIKQIREQYGLSQRSFAKLLNWGDKTIYRYENGSLQDKAHNSLLCFLKKPQNMRQYLNDNEIIIGESQKVKLLQRIDQLENDENIGADSKLMQLLFLKRPSLENGFRSFDFDKFCAMVVYFANRCDMLLKVKLLKLLNYSDMLFYKENGISISGARYVHLPYGPVPENYQVLFGMMEAKNIAHIDIQFINGYERHEIKADTVNLNMYLSSEELAVLDRVYLKFENFGSAEISEYSHCEKGYRETKQGEIISYAYAKNMIF